MGWRMRHDHPRYSAQEAVLREVLIPFGVLRLTVVVVRRAQALLAIIEDTLSRGVDT